MAKMARERMMMFREGSFNTLLPVLDLELRIIARFSQIADRFVWFFSGVRVKKETTQSNNRIEITSTTLLINTPSRNTVKSSN